MAYPISKRVILPIYGLWMRKIECIENFPVDRPFIVAANHTSYYDILILPCIIIPKLNKKMSALVNSYYWKGFFTRFFLNMWEAIPVFVEKEDKSREKNEQSLEKAAKFLNEGRIIMMFPEGGRSKDGKLKKAYNGIAKIALKSGAPVVPAGFIGADNVLPRGKFFPRFERCDVKIGKPLYFRKYYNKKTNEKILEEITRKIMKEIGKLTGQEYNY